MIEPFKFLENYLQIQKMNFWTSSSSTLQCLQISFIVTNDPIASPLIRRIFCISRWLLRRLLPVMFCTSRAYSTILPGIFLSCMLNVYLNDILNCLFSIVLSTNLRSPLSHFKIPPARLSYLVTIWHNLSWFVIRVFTYFWVVFSPLFTNLQSSSSYLQESWRDLTPFGAVWRNLTHGFTLSFWTPLAVFCFIAI